MHCDFDSFTLCNILILIIYGGRKSLKLTKCMEIKSELRNGQFDYVLQRLTNLRETLQLLQITTNTDVSRGHYRVKHTICNF